MLNVYLAGKIHSNWREEIIQLCEKAKLDVKFTSSITDHEASENCGVEILGAEEKIFGKIKKVLILIPFEPKNLFKIMIGIIKYINNTTCNLYD